jgi:prepilin-type N-terminal cleavage/methylation domain-containing protein
MSRKGFTLIELLMVIVIIGLLASIAIPKLANTREKAIVASMKSDLHNLVTAEEVYFSDSMRYTTNLGARYRTSAGVVGPTITLTGDGWTAKVSHPSTAKICAVFTGSTPLPPATKEGAPSCTP